MRKLSQISLVKSNQKENSVSSHNSSEIYFHNFSCVLLPGKCVNRPSAIVVPRMPLSYFSSSCFLTCCINTTCKKNRIANISIEGKRRRHQQVFFTISMFKDLGSV